MARTRSQDTMVDHLVAAIVPALIMVMVGGLMLFLLDIWYEGPFLARLRWILFWFVFGIVLITRVGMQIGGEQAKGYGVALGGAVGLVATSLAGFQPFLLAVMGLVWWATHKLTYDCTLIDEDQDAGVGLLQESGLDPSAVTYAHDDPEVMDASLLPRRPWWKHWGHDPGDAHRPHPPGIWLIYFSLASLPVFGLGQWLVPAVEADRRAGLLIYFVAYLASAMGLLLATSFLNLRRYLRKRKIPMPSAMTATWLTTGAVMVVGLTLTSVVLLPLLSGFRTMSGASLASSDRRASRWAMLKDGGVQGEGAASEGDAASKSARPQQESGEPEGSGKNNDPNAARQTNGQGRQGGKSGPGRSKSGAPRGKPSSSKGGAAGKQGGRQDRSSSQGKGQDQADRGKEAEPDSRQGNEQDSERDDNSSPPPDQGPNNPVPPSSLSFQAPSWLRIPVLIAGIIFLIFGAVRYGPDLLKGLWAMIGALLGGLWFGGPKKPKAKEDAEVSSAPEPPPQPFASFANPFDTGLDHRLKPDDLVIYSFEALEAWAYEHDLGRSPHETPTEFVRRVGQTRPGLGADAARLASFFVTITYGRRGFKAEILPHLRKFWRAIEGGGAPAIAEHTADV